LAGGGLSAIAFVSAMVVGMFATIQAEAFLARRRSSTNDELRAQSASSVAREHAANP